MQRRREAQRWGMARQCAELQFAQAERADLPAKGTPELLSKLRVLAHENREFGGTSASPSTMLLSTASDLCPCAAACESPPCPVSTSSDGTVASGNGSDTIPA